MTDICITADGELITVIQSDDIFQLLKLPSRTKTDAVQVTELPLYLRNHVLVIDSASSGAGRGASPGIYQQVIQPLFEILAIKHQYVLTQSATHIAEIAASLSHERDTTVLIISGDTSIQEFVNGLGKIATPKKIFIATIPHGTGNALSRSLRPDNGPLLAVKSLLEGSFGAFPIYEVQFPPLSSFVASSEPVSLLKFVVVLSWGFHASLVADSDTPEMRKLGLQRFQVAAQDNLKREQIYHGTVEILAKGNVLTADNGPFSYVVVTPVTRFEPTFEISPQGNVFENSLYLVSFKGVEKNEEILEIMHKVYAAGSHIHDPRVTYQKIMPGDVLKLAVNESGETKRRVCVDGAIVASGKGAIEVTCLGNHVNGWDLRLIG
ncbi:hypothetical protein BABINDRAFT_163851 [Babjeviella inositovora NRRL Y-12698]|uniref:DAGKc domain-containing protein n=1 Tax=Babjeviella inositovora NRRL Y-12698 TaxID=984486 RepID=A0A1E3QI56_9ASCO|nr:uncharacterized protein BABINDRAFT_163851 [Babjeviella inositovora NRRL Y-12698]ODQ77124.1 hypothetical protein BABINDRAFT_163851 [Babjeviella inositovora NRRL Y-12698]